MARTDSEEPKNYLAWSGGVLLAILLPLGLMMAAAPPGSAGMAAGAFCAAAPFAVGALLGFLFGIPRTAENDTKPQSAQPNGGVTYKVNTNLEQISDWLTKILVGVGLTQLRELRAEFLAAATYAGKALSTDGAGKALSADRATSIAALVLVYFVVAGFFAGYLVTRLLLTGLLASADRNANPDPNAVKRLIERPLDGGPALAKGTPATDKDKKEVLRFKLTDLRSPSEAIAWGRAKLDDGDKQAAGVAFERAMRQAIGEEDTESRRRSTEGLMLTALYEPPPQGFMKAIAAAEAYFASPNATKAASLYAWASCAYGQAYAWEKEHGKSQEKLTLYRDKALEFARLTVKTDLAWKGTLAGVLRPDFPGADDDLVSFKDDPDFVDLLTK